MKLIQIFDHRGNSSVLAVLEFILSSEDFLCCAVAVHLLSTICVFLSVIREGFDDWSKFIHCKVFILENSGEFYRIWWFIHLLLLAADFGTLPNHPWTMGIGLLNAKFKNESQVLALRYWYDCMILALSIIIISCILLAGFWQGNLSL